MNRHERRREEKEAPQRANIRGVEAGSMVADQATADAFGAALALQQAGRLAEAERAWENLRATLPNHDGVNVNLATVLWRLDRLDDAVTACRRAIAGNPNLAEGYAMLGVILQAQGDNRGAVNNLERAVHLRDDLVTAWVQLANLHKQQEDLGRALAACKRAEALEPGRADTLNTLGLVRQARREWDAAEIAFRAAAKGVPMGQPRAQIETNLAALYMAQERFDLAAKSCRAAIDAHPIYPQAYNILGAALKATEDLTGAEVAFRKAFELDPTMTAAQVNLGTVLGMRRQWYEALACYGRALEMSPDCAEAMNNRGNVLHSIGRFDEAQNDFEQAILINPEYPDPHLNLGLQFLMQGRWTEAWPEFEWRWRTPQMEPFRRPFAEPQWDGSAQPGATLLVHAEQGLGDTLNFIRYAPLAAARVGRLVLESQPSLVSLLAGMESIDAVVARTEILPSFDMHVPLLSLPGIFGTTPETVPVVEPYLRAPEDIHVPIPAGDGLKVGLVWAGNPNNPFDPSRTAGLAALKEVLDVADCTFYSLQYGDPGDQIFAEGMQGRIHDLRPLLTDFAATAALVDQLDVVISICTSVAHLAGGMGAETWVILSQDADWRWMRDRNDSPWYPSVRLFRQSELDDWSELAVRVAEALKIRALSAV